MSGSKMDHWERIRAAVKGEEVDHVPISLWRHWPVDDETADGLAAVMLNWQKEYDFDLVKFMPTGTYGIEDWGAETIYVPNHSGTRTITAFGLTDAEQWPHLESLDVSKGYLGKQNEALRLSAEKLQNSVPILQTIFSPLTTARKLAGEQVFTDLRRNPDLFKAGLQIIADTTVRFAKESLRLGAHGTFFASQCGTYQLLSEDEYKEFGEHFDLIILEAMQEAEFNMVHAHGQDIMFDLISNYPTNMLNWHDRRTEPSLNEAKRTYTGLVVGGVNEWETLVHGPVEAIRAEIKEAIAQTNGRSLMVGPGCIVPGHVPAVHIRAAIQAVKE